MTEQSYCERLLWAHRYVEDQKNECLVDFDPLFGYTVNKRDSGVKGLVFIGQSADFVKAVEIAVQAAEGRDAE